MQFYKFTKTVGSELVKGDLLSRQHYHAWYDVWRKGRVDIGGNISLARIVTASYFYILSSVPIREDRHWPYYGLSPNGLPWGGNDDVKLT